MRPVGARHVTLAYAQWGRVQMADAEAEAAPRPEMQRLVAALRARLWQLQTELREQEVSEASSRAYCRGFCQVGAGQGRAAAQAAGRVAGGGAGARVGRAGRPRRGARRALPVARGFRFGDSACPSGAAARCYRVGTCAPCPKGQAWTAWGRAGCAEGAARLWALTAPRAWAARRPSVLNPK